MSDTNTTAPTSPMPSYVASLLRTVGAVLGGYLIEKGFISAQQAPELGGAVLAIIVVAWSLVQKYNAHKALTAAKAT
jgi:hypothetical protein